MWGGRAPQGILVVRRDGGRQEVIATYRRWLWARLQEPGSPQERELRRLLGLARQGELRLVQQISVS